ncbi:hypothetical protein [Paenibacillus whitsoniae]|nr:hypothetical protein [Paenibacillus whitsoniae]
MTGRSRRGNVYEVRGDVDFRFGEASADGTFNVEDLASSRGMIGR